jgi:hypothetical protein
MAARVLDCIVSARNDGGPAFPQVKRWDNWCLVDESGMTLRDYFAAKALPIAFERQPKSGSTGQELYWNPEAPPEYDLAARAYVIADAMLYARTR